MTAPVPTGHPFLDQPCPLAFAHRGAHEEAGENTGDAFAAAVDLGYRHIETDVQASRDGVAVIFHDDTLDRMTGAAGRIDEHEWCTLARLRTARGEPLLRLDEALAAFPRTYFNVDAKTGAAVEPIARAVRDADAVGRVCAGSFDVRRTLRLQHALGPRLCWSPSHLGVFRLWLAGWHVPLAKPPFRVVQVPPRFRGAAVVTPRFVQAAHARAVQVHVWTVDDPAEMDRLLDMGVDGLMTDRPRLLRSVLQRRGAWQPAP